MRAARAIGKNLETCFSRASGHVRAWSVDQASQDHLCSVGLVVARNGEDLLAVARTDHLGYTSLDWRDSWLGLLPYSSGAAFRVSLLPPALVHLSVGLILMRKPRPIISAGATC